ncbi:MAG: NAD(P)H-dependent oxidoreductase [Actinomycetota bacterium]|nr:NAD(P)H-dependent oxidoreductase [Actinomycetota bacterium]
MRLLAISGSLRSDSHNTRLLRIAAEEAPAGVDVQIWGGLAEVPPYNGDADHGAGPEPVSRLRDLIAEADGLIFATPEYNSSVPGVLKNAIDWASRPRSTTSLAGKPAAVMGATTGHFGAVWAQAELRKILGATGVRVVDAEFALALADDAFDAVGNLSDEAALDTLRELVGAVVSEAEHDRKLPLAA